MLANALFALACHGSDRPRTSSSMSSASPLVPVAPSAVTSTSAIPPTAASPAASASTGVSALPSNAVFPSDSAHAPQEAASARRVPFGVTSPPFDLTIPEAVATLRVVEVGGGRVEDASRVVALMRAGVRVCYQRGLADDRKMKGNLRLTLEIDTQGHVAGVTSKADGGSLDPSVTSCVVDRVKLAEFLRPEGSDTARIEFTVVLESRPARYE
jgi:hypothetical protein